MKGIRYFFMALGAIWAIGVIAIGIGGTYLEHNPDEAAAYAVAAMGVDSDAGMIDQAGQMVDNYSSARSMIRDSQSYESRSRAERAQRAATEQGWGGDASAAGYAAEASGFEAE